MAASTEKRILLAAGEDQPGVLDEVSKYLLEHGAAIEEIRMTNLCGQFAMLMLLSGDRATLSHVSAGLEGLAHRTALQFAMQSAREDVRPEGHLYRLGMAGGHESATLRKIRHLLRAPGVNIDQVETRSTAEGFEMEMSFLVRREMPITNLREYVDQLLGPLKVRWDLSAL